MFSWFQVDPLNPRPRSRLPILFAFLILIVMLIGFLLIVEAALSVGGG